MHVSLLMVPRLLGYRYGTEMSMCGQAKLCETAISDRLPPGLRAVPNINATIPAGNTFRAFGEDDSKCFFGGWPTSSDVESTITVIPGLKTWGTLAKKNPTRWAGYRSNGRLNRMLPC
jgi:hypothetical protein